MFACKIRFLRLFQYFQEVTSYYHHFRFAATDLLLILGYLWKNPYRLSRQYAQKYGDDNLHVYGETPLKTLAKITSRGGVSAKDKIIELGAGRGRTVFWLSSFVGCQVVGIECIPEFVKKAQGIARLTKTNKVSFLLQDMLEADLKGATVVYLYGTCLSDDIIALIAEKLSDLPAGARVITVSYSLAEYSPEFKVIDQFPAQFLWGEGQVFVNQRLP
ncbi:MAG: SAM-dependent methyltransferase [Chlamydiota bacterium]